jgi:hypothetical protein
MLKDIANFFATDYTDFHRFGLKNPYQSVKFVAEKIMQEVYGFPQAILEGKL